MEGNNATEMEVTTENLYQCDLEPPAACVNAPAWTLLHMDLPSSLQPIRNHSGSCFNAFPTWGATWKVNIYSRVQAASFQTSRKPFFPCWMALLCLAGPFLSQDHIPCSLGQAGSSSRLGTWHSAELSPPGRRRSHRAWQSPSGKMHRVWWQLLWAVSGLHLSHNSRELGQGQGAMRRMYKKLGHRQQDGLGEKQLLFPGSHCPQQGSAFPLFNQGNISLFNQRREEILHPAFPLFNPDTGGDSSPGFTPRMIHEATIINHQAKLLCWAL